MEKNNDARIKAEKNKLKRIFKNLPEERRKIVEKLIERAAFMLVTLEDMEAEINSGGLVVEMQQGKYIIDRAHPLLSSHNAMIKNFSTVTKQLCDMLPNNEQEKAGRAVMSFVTKPK